MYGTSAYREITTVFEVKGLSKYAVIAVLLKETSHLLRDAGLIIYSQMRASARTTEAAIPNIWFQKFQKLLPIVPLQSSDQKLQGYAFAWVNGER